MTTHSQSIHRNAKFISYVLGHRPDEFGLIPDDQGFVTIKTLMKALQEEPGWSFIKTAHLHELIISLQPPPIEINGQLIRAVDRRQLPTLSGADQIPKLLFAAIRRRTYPVVLERGLHPAGNRYVMLTSAMTMAIRLGHRIDNDPIILTVQTMAAQEKGVSFKQYGPDLYLTDFIPNDTISRPPLAREKKKPDKPEKLMQSTPPSTPGSYFPDVARWAPNESGLSRNPARKEKAWQKERRQARKQKKRSNSWSG